MIGFIINSTIIVIIIIIIVIIKITISIVVVFIVVVIIIITITILIFMPVPGSPGEMQWKVALCHGRDCQNSLNRVTAVPSEAGPARARKGCSTAWYTLHSQSTSQGWLPAGSNRLLSRQVNCSVKATGSRPLPNLADNHQLDIKDQLQEVEEGEKEEGGEEEGEEECPADGYTDICSTFCLFSSHCCTKTCEVGAHNHVQLPLLAFKIHRGSSGESMHAGNVEHVKDQPL